MTASPPGEQTPHPPAPPPDRRRFIEHTLANRTDASGRELLAGDWRYIRTLLGARAETERLDVLDLACGSGHQSLAWAERGHRVVGLDFDRDLLVAGHERVRRAGGSLAVDWAQADATALPFQTASFDVVFNNSLLEHVPAWEKVVAETARVLRPGGIYIMYTTNRWSPRQQEVNHFPFYSWLPDPIQQRVLAWIMAHRRDLVNFTDFPAIHWFTFGGMRQAFRNAGMEPVDRVDLLARMDLPGAKGKVARILALNDVWKWPYYLYTVSMTLYGVRR